MVVEKSISFQQEKSDVARLSPGFGWQ